MEFPNLLEKNLGGEPVGRIQSGLQSMIFPNEAFNFFDKENLSLSTSDEWKKTTASTLPKLCKDIKNGYLFLLVDKAWENRFGIMITNHRYSLEVKNGCRPSEFRESLVEWTSIWKVEKKNDPRSWLKRTERLKNGCL